MRRGNSCPRREAAQWCWGRKKAEDVLQPQLPPEEKGEWEGAARGRARLTPQSHCLLNVGDPCQPCHPLRTLFYTLAKLVKPFPIAAYGAPANCDGSDACQLPL